jgi:hypothetical protein
MGIAQWHLALFPQEAGDSWSRNIECTSLFSPVLSAGFWHRDMKKADPIFAAIEQHDRAWAIYMAMTDDRAAAMAANAWRQAAWRLVAIEPATIEGVAALAKIARLQRPDGASRFEGLADRNAKREWMQAAFRSIARALDRIAKSQPADAAAD